MTVSDLPRGIRFGVTGLLLAVLCAATAWASTGRRVQERLDAEIAAGNPIVVHVVVALCDNVNQGIVPVPRALGNGQDPRSNLYWGALYGVKTHLSRAAGWSKLETDKPQDPRILDRVALKATVDRQGGPVEVYLVADAWDGAQIRRALGEFLAMAAGRSPQTIQVRQGARQQSLQAGGAAHLLAYVGHNGLMDFSLPSPRRPQTAAPARAALILACASKNYFRDHLKAADAHPLLLTTGLMAPEAYTLDAAIRAWIGQGRSKAVTDGAAKAYHRYQKCGLRAAQRLFWGESWSSSRADQLVQAAIERTSHSVTYDGRYRRIDYPGGDVPGNVGVCTDLVIRSFRALGIDLQQAVHEDMRRAFSKYPQNWGLERPDANIDHRRVPNLRAFFKRHGQSLGVSQDPADYKPGDLVTWMLPGNLPHIGIVTDRRSADGKRPLIVHNIGAGPKLEDALFEYTITGRYRFGVDD